MTDTTTAATPLPLPSTCKVRALVCFVTRKLSRFTKYARAALRDRKTMKNTSVLLADTI